MINKLDGEKTILYHLLKNSAYFYKVFSKLNSNVFKNNEAKIIYKYLKKYYSKFEKKPTLKELALFILNSSLSDIEKNKIKQYLKDLNTETEIKNFDFLLDFTEKYLKKISLTDAILESVEILKKDETLDGIDIITKFENALNYKFDTDLGMELKSSLEERFKQYKAKFDTLPTGIIAIDKILGGGFRPKTLSLILAPSHQGKCLRKNTKLNIYMDDKTFKRFQEWKKKKENS